MASEIDAHEAKSRLLALLQRVARGEHFTITQYGQPIASLVAFQSSDRRMPRKGNLAEFFARSPLRGAGLSIERLPGRLRNVEL